MAPKKAKQSEEWNECLKCRRVVHKRDVVQHKDDCSAAHGYVLDSVLHALIAAPSTQTKDTLSKLPLLKREHTILINSSVMWVCGLAIGQPCLVNSHHVLTLWPCNSLPATSILLPPILADIITESAAGEACTVIVERFTPSGSVEAERIEIELELEKPAFQTEEFLQVLRYKMEGMYVTQDLKHAIHYFGQKCTFWIRSIQHLQVLVCDLNTAAPLSTGSHAGASELSESLSSLDISGISDGGDSLNASLSATPGKLPGGNTTSDDSQSPAATTPVRSERGRPEQFCTPVLDKGKEQKKDSARFVKVTAQTQFAIRESCGEGKESSGSTGTREEKVTFDSLGGLDSQIEQIRQYCLGPLQALQQDSSAGLVLPRGILLFGPTGTGKSMLAQAIANELGIYTEHISPTDLFSKYFGETEKTLKNVFEAARRRSPSLIIVDNIDILCPNREVSKSDLEKRTVSTFLTLMDGVLNKRSKEVCIVIGITSKPDSLDPALRRPGRFETEIETGVPTAPDRFQILKKLLQDVPRTVSDGDLKVIADSAHGYVGADLAGVVSKARQLRWKDTRDLSAQLRMEDLRLAATLVPPSAMREVQFEVPQVRWSDIGGQQEVKLKLRQSVEWPLTHPETFERLGIAAPRGCLLYGPPGCSKTMIAKALATESGLNFLAVKGPELFGKYVGESERAVRELFRKARMAAPSIIFFDEIDSLAVERGKSSGGNSVADRVLTQLLTEMDGVVELRGVTIVAATNRPDMIDKALLRPGRFDRILYVPLPDAVTRKEILQIVTRRIPVAPDVSVEELVNRTERYSGAELTALCHEAGLCAMTESREANLVHMRHFEAAFGTVQPQTTLQMIKFYEEYSSRSQAF